MRRVVDDSARHGLLRGNERILFTTAYFHDPDEILGEFGDAGLREARRYALEGVFGLYADIDEWLDDPERRDMLLDVARRSEGEPTLLGVAGHMLTVAQA
ncbi:hypothetical protein [Microtetraspora fusca]|uniref:hypothetical protein n=1 Tax=Microtetraspora fusca TaxID=1997 RepID=UPI000B329E90|nr:hypothetical protein [Microtetraspora fusca]